MTKTLEITTLKYGRLSFSLLFKEISFFLLTNIQKIIQSYCKRFNLSLETFFNYFYLERKYILMKKINKLLANVLLTTSFLGVVSPVATMRFNVYVP